MNIRASLKLFAILATAIFFFTIPASAQRVWTKVSQYLGATGIEFPTTDTGYVTFGGDSLSRTTNGGESWSPVKLPIAHPNPYYDLLLTFYGSDGWLITFEKDSTMSSGLDARLFKTTDYGFTWSGLPMDSSWVPFSIHFKSPSLGYLWGNAPGKSQLFTSFWISTDGGRTWIARASPPAGWWGNAIYAVGQPNVIIGEGGEGDIGLPYISVDTGGTWIAAGSEFSHIGEMAYIGSNTWVTTNAWSIDDGRTWNPTHTTAPNETPYGPMVTDTLGHAMFISRLAYYDSGLLYFTNDYGRSWDSANVPFPKIGVGTIIGDEWYVIPANIDSEPPYVPMSLYRSVAVPSRVDDGPPHGKVRILTNPAAQNLLLSSFPSSETIRISDCLGRIVLESKGQSSIDISSLPAGLYWIETKTGVLPFVHVE